MKKETPIESAGRALARWCIDQAYLREQTRKRAQLDGQTVFYAPVPRMTVQKERVN